MRDLLKPRSYGRRPQRYHAWDVFEVAPRIEFSRPGHEKQAYPLVNFSKAGLCFDIIDNLLGLEVGDLLEGAEVHFGEETLLTTQAKIKHISQDPTTKHCHVGVRFLQGKLDPEKIFAIREEFQDSLDQIKRLQMTQRAPRVDRKVLDQLDVQASFAWQGRQIKVGVENISQFGICFSLSALTEMELFASASFTPETLLEDFILSMDARVLFHGPVRVIHSRQEGESLIVGVHCLGGQAVLVEGFESALKLREAKQDFLNFLESTHRSHQIRPEFKIALNDFRYFLESMKSYLESTEIKLEKISSIKEREGSLEAVLRFSERKLSEEVLGLVEKMEQVVLTFSQEEDEIHRQYFQDQMLELTNACLFSKRALEKPLGYPGDYEMMNNVYHRTRAGDNLWERLMSSCFNRSAPGPQAGRNRVEYLQDKISQTITARSHQSSIHILSLACGPCEEIQRYLSEEASGRTAELYFYLLDQEERALDYAQRSLYPLAAKLAPHSKRIHFKFLRQGVKHLLKNPKLVAAYPKMDLIYSAGLFDYLPAELAKGLTEVLLSMISQRGRLIIGNFKEYYPTKFLIQYVSNWFLIHRSPEELIDFLPDSWQSHASVEQEKSGVNLFLNVHHPAQGVSLVESNTA